MEREKSEAEGSANNGGQQSESECYHIGDRSSSCAPLRLCTSSPCMFRCIHFAFFYYSTSTIPRPMSILHLCHHRHQRNRSSINHPFCWDELNGQLTWATAAWIQLVHHIMLFTALIHPLLFIAIICALSVTVYFSSQKDM